MPDDHEQQRPQEPLQEPVALTAAVAPRLTNKHTTSSSEPVSGAPTGSQQRTSPSVTPSTTGTSPAAANTGSMGTARGVTGMSDKAAVICLIIAVLVAFTIVGIGIVNDGLGTSTVAVTTGDDESNSVMDDADAVDGSATNLLATQEEDSALMIDVVGLSLAEAQMELGQVFSDINIEQESISGDDPIIWNSGNWEVCSQSVAVGDRFGENETLSLIYSHQSTGCASAEQWAETVDLQWRSAWDVDEWRNIAENQGAEPGARSIDGREESSIRSVSSEKVGELRVNMISGTIGRTTASTWAQDLREQINASLDEGVTKVANVSVYVNGDKADEPVTREGIDEAEARRACVSRLMDGTENGGRVQWMDERNAILLADGNSVWSITAQVRAPSALPVDTEYQMACVVGGSRDAPVVTEFELR